MISEAISKENLVFFTNLGRGGPSRNAGKPDHWSETHGVEGGPRGPPCPFRPWSESTGGSPADHGRNPMGSPDNGSTGGRSENFEHRVNSGHRRGPCGAPAREVHTLALFFLPKITGLWVHNAPPQKVLGPKAIGPPEHSSERVRRYEISRLFVQRLH